MKKILKKIIGVTGYSLVKKHTRNPQVELPLTKQHFLELFISLVDTKNFFFVQIGAQDGKTEDPIYPFVTKYNLHGICVEPQPDAFKRLQETYKDFPNVRCINTLIGDTQKPFYVVRDEYKTFENWAAMTRISSYDKEIVKHSLKRKVPRGTDLDKCIRMVYLPTMTLQELLKKEKIEKIGLFQTDAQGYDFEIIKMLDFDKFKPRIINIESCYFNDNTRKIFEALLKEKGYHFFRDKVDTCAYLT